MKSFILTICSILFLSQSAFSIAPTWTCNSSLFQHSMTFTGVIKINNIESTNTNDIVGAFVGEECRGVAKPVFIEALNRYIVFMVLYSGVASGENVTFKIYSANQDNIYIASQTKNFLSFESEGNVDNPFIWSYASPNTKANILSYSFVQQSEPAVIDSLNHIIAIKVVYGTSLNALIASYTLSVGATAKVGNITQVSNSTVNNFTNPLVYIVTAENNTNITNWTINVSESAPNYSLLIKKNEGGTVKDNNRSLMNDTVLTVAGGSIKTFTITPDTGYEIATITYNNTDVKPQIINNEYTTPIINNNASLIVSFKKIQYRLSLKDASSGTINLLCEYGATPSFDFTPSTDWKVNSIFYNSVDVTSSLLNGIYTVSTITDNALLIVSFVSTVTEVPEIINNKIKVYNRQSEIIVEGTSEGEIITLFSVEGKQIQNFKSIGERIIIQANKDTYLLRTKYKTFKVIL